MQEREKRPVELFRAMDRARRAWCSVTPGDTLNKAQFGTLLLIARHRGQENTDPVMLSALAAEMGQSLPAISQRIRALEELGCLERLHCSEDRRVTGVQITDEGLRILELARRRFDQILAQALDRLGPENADTLIELLTELASALEDTATQSTHGGDPI